MPTTTENKVQYGLKNVYYAVWDGTQYGTPKPIPGAVNLTLESEGDMQKFYADDSAYFVTNTNNGYSGDLEVARFPDQMLQDIWGFTLHSTDKVLTENASAQAVPFALLYQVAGDQNNTLFVLYSCTATRPGIGSQTKEETTEPRTQSVNITAVPNADGVVARKSTKDTPSSVTSAWFTSVYSPTA